MNPSNCRPPSNQAVRSFLFFDLSRHEACSREQHGNTPHASVACRAVIKLLCLIFFLFAPLLFTGCATPGLFLANVIPQGLPAKSYPVRATLEVKVEGQPVKISRDFHCEEFVVRDASCPGCIRWRSTLPLMVEPLSGGGVLLVSLGNRCSYTTGELDDRPLNTISWADNIEQPNRVEIYDATLPSVSDLYAKNPKILIKSIKLNLVRLGENDTVITTNVNEKKAAWFINKQDKSASRFYRRLSGFGVRVIPREIWSNIFWITKEANTNSMHLFDLPQEYTRELRSLQNKNSEKFRSGDIYNKIAFHIPGKYSDGDTWELDNDNIGIKILYFEEVIKNAAFCSKLEMEEQRENIKNKYNKRSIIIGNMQIFQSKPSSYLYIPENGNLYTVGSFATIDDYFNQ